MGTGLSGVDPEGGMGSPNHSGGARSEEDSAMTFPHNSSLQIFPNPVKDQVSNLRFEMNQEQVASISIVNNIGQLIQTVVKNNTYPPGTHQLELATQNLVPGVYFVVLEQEGKRSVEKLVVLQ